MGDEQGDRPPPFHVDWIDGSSAHHSDQLEVGRYSPRDFKKDPMSRVLGWNLVGLLRSRVGYDF